MSQRTLCSSFRRRSFLTIAASAAFALAGLVASSAQAAPLLTGLGSYDPRDDAWSGGYGFVLNTPVTVTDLGAWDDLGNGFIGMVRVQLWAADGTTNLADLSFTGTGGSTLGSNNYRYFPLTTPVALAAGTYILGATYGADLNAPRDLMMGPDLVTHNAEITSTDAGWGQRNAAPAYSGGAGNTAYTGPNLIYAVPEPASLGLLGLAGLAMLRRRR